MHTWRTTGRRQRRAPPPQPRGAMANRGADEGVSARRHARPGPTAPASSPKVETDHPERRGPALSPRSSAAASPEVRRGAHHMDRNTSDFIARHLVAAGDLLDEDPQAALEHARAARERSGRIAAVREAVGIAAYRCGDWSQAIAELRAARRLGSKSPLLPLIADCERGLGRPERAIELARSPEAAATDRRRRRRTAHRRGRRQIRSRAAGSGPRDSVDAATRSDANRADRRPTVLCLCRNVARTRTGQEALQWFINAAAADVEGVTDAEERITELS